MLETSCTALSHKLGYVVLSTLPHLVSGRPSVAGRGSAQALLPDLRCCCVSSS